MIWWRRLGNLLLIGLITVLLLEAVLQLGAVAVRAFGRDAAVVADNGGVKVITLGDSNTYGLYYPETKAWPARFEALWNAQYPGQPVSVINLGYPGTNSARVRANIDGFLARTNPDWVFVMIGNNDFWTPREDPAQPVRVAVQPGVLDWLRDQSRVYRLAYMLGRTYRGHIVNTAPRLVLPESVLSDVEKQKAFGEALGKALAKQMQEQEAARRAGQQPAPDAAASEYLSIDGERFPMTLAAPSAAMGNLDNLQPNLSFIAERVQAYGARLVLLTYPGSGSFYPLPSAEMRALAARTGLPLVDLQAFFQQLCQGDVACHDYFLLDAHPNAKGYEQAAAYLVQRFAEIRAAVPAAGDGS